MMPDVSGPELASALKENRPEMRVMLMSGFADGAMVVLNHGWHFITKPFLASALLVRVNDVLHSDVREQGRTISIRDGSVRPEGLWQRKNCARRACGVG
jgi:FixJ family two-component response regulator